MRRVVTLLLILLPLTAVAQNRANNNKDSHFRRTSLFEELDIGRRDIVLIGDGLIDEGEWSELFNNRRVKNRGITGDLSSDVLDRLHLVVKGQPRKVFVMVGVNDLCTSNTPESVVNNIDEIIAKFKIGSPRTKVYLLSILPASDKIHNLKVMQVPNEDILQEIRETNSHIEELCKSRGATYVDLYKLFVGANGQIKPEFSSDGLHLVGEAYLVLRDALTPYMR